MRPLSVLLIDIAGRAAALPVAAVADLLPLPRLTRPPGCPAALAGFADVGGRALPVVDVARVFGLGEAGELPFYGHILVPQGDSGLGLLVDRADAVATLDQDALTPAGDGDRLAACVVGEVVLGDRVVALLDLARILDARERAVVAEAAAAAGLRRAAFGLAP